MENVIYIVGRIFRAIFIDTGGTNASLIQRIINFISINPYLYLGAIFVIIGFSVSMIRRLIHS